MTRTALPKVFAIALQVAATAAVIPPVTAASAPLFFFFAIAGHPKSERERREKGAPSNLDHYRDDHRTTSMLRTHPIPNCLANDL